MASNRTSRLPPGITTRRRADGQVVFEVRHRTPTGQPRRKRFEDVAAAKTYLATVQADLAKNRYIDPQDTDRTVREVAELWMASNPAKRAGTAAHDEVDLRVRILPAFGHRKIGTVRPDELQAAVNGWLVDRAPATVARTKAILHAVFAYAEHLEIIPRNPVRRVRVGTLEPRPAMVLDDDQITRLLDAFKPQHRLAVHVALETGLRWGEVMGLRASFLDPARGTLSVVTQVDGQAPKSRASKRTIALSEGLAHVLIDQARLRRSASEEADPLLFPTAVGGPMDRAHWRQRIWLPAVKAAGLDGLRFHDLRKNNATRLLHAGVDARTAQARLGHADVRTTLTVYAQTTTAADRAAAIALGARLPAPSTRSGTASARPVDAP